PSRWRPSRSSSRRNAACSSALRTPSTVSICAAWTAKTCSSRRRPSSVSRTCLARRSVVEASRTTNPARSSRSTAAVTLGGRADEQAVAQVGEAQAGQPVALGPVQGAQDAPLRAGDAEAAEVRVHDPLQQAERADQRAEGVLLQRVGA